MSLKLYELAIYGGDRNPITTFRMADSIADLTEDILTLRLTHPTDTIHVWEMDDDLERTTEEYIHIFDQAIVDIESGKIQLPRPPMGGFPMDIMGIPGFVEITGPGECICGQCHLEDDQLEFGFDERNK